jgi:hypothetical protein
MTARRDSEWQLTCAVLEAIGLGYLRPDGLVPHFNPVKKRKEVLDTTQIIM